MTRTIAMFLGSLALATSAMAQAPAAAPPSLAFHQVADPLDRNGNYYGNNYQAKQTDTAFIALDSDLGGGWRLNDKAYTFSYSNNSHESPANNGGATLVNGRVVAGTDLAGRFKVNFVRALGDTLALTRRTASFDVTPGVVATYVHNQAAPNLGRMGVLVALKSSGNAEVLAGLGRKIAMHVASAAPIASARTVGQLDDLLPMATLDLRVDEVALLDRASAAR